VDFNRAITTIIDAAVTVIMAGELYLLTQTVRPTCDAISMFSAAQSEVARTRLLEASRADGSDN
jgi:hypothetical protein